MPGCGAWVRGCRKVITFGKRLNLPGARPMQNKAIWCIAFGYKNAIWRTWMHDLDRWIMVAGRGCIDGK